MALTTRSLSNVGAPLYTPGGTLLANVRVSFTLVNPIGQPTDAFDITTNERVTGETIIMTDAFGEFTVNLCPNDRGDKTTKYVCRCDATPDFSSQVPSGVGPLSWYAFKTAGAILTVAEVSLLDQHIANALLHLSPQQNTLLDSLAPTLTATEINYLDGVTSSIQTQFNNLPLSNVYSVNTRTGNVTITKTDVGLTNVDNTSDVNKPVSTAQATADALVYTNAQEYANSILTNLWNDRGAFNATVNTYPTTGGSGTAGAIMKGDIWTISVAATAGPLLGYIVGSTVRALITTPGQTGTNWAVSASGLGYTPLNKDSNLSDLASVPTAKLNLGLNNVDNTSDATKPVSTAQAIAIAAVTKTTIGLGNVDNTSDVNKPVSTSHQTALDLKAPKAFPSFTGDIRSTLTGNENIVIDARTNPRLMTAGVLRIEHTAGMSGTRPISIDVDANGYGDTHAVAINYVATGGVAGNETHIIDVAIDTDAATGGDIQAMAVTKTGAGISKVCAIHAHNGVDVVEQSVGTTIVADTNFVYNSSTYTNRTAEFDSLLSNVPIFVASTDYIYIGHSVKFASILVDLFTPASGAGIIPTFEYSDGANSWALFSPNDGTNGFRQTGTISFSSSIPWVTRTVNLITGKFWIRIRRTNAAVITSPVENTIRVNISELFYWDATGKLDISRLEIRNIQTFSTVANAIAGGLTVGNVFRDTNGALFIV